jgi:hypothetical protein
MYVCVCVCMRVLRVYVLYVYVYYVLYVCICVYMCVYRVLYHIQKPSMPKIQGVGYIKMKIAHVLRQVEYSNGTIK